MSEYFRDSGHFWMRTCDSCGGAFNCSAPKNEGRDGAPDWVCGTCKAHEAEITRLRAALKPFSEFGRAVPGSHITITYAQRDAGARVTNHDFRAALQALEEA